MSDFPQPSTQASLNSKYWTSIVPENRQKQKKEKNWLILSYTQAKMGMITQDRLDWMACSTCYTALCLPVKKNPAVLYSLLLAPSALSLIRQHPRLEPLPPAGRPDYVCGRGIHQTQGNLKWHRQITIDINASLMGDHWLSVSITKWLFPPTDMELRVNSIY